MAGNSSQAAGTNDAGLEQWRRRFDGADIFTVLTHAILVAATDSPREFRRRRDNIVEQIYSAPAVLPVVAAVAAGEGPSGAARRVSAENAGNNNQHVHGDGDSLAGTDAEVGLDSDLLKLADDMKEATLENEEVLRIKAILLNHHEQSAEYLFEALRRLQLMQLTGDVLENTKIEVAVTALAKHKSQEIRELVLDIASGWKVTSEEWNAYTKVAMAGDSDKSLHPTNSSAAEDEWGLAIPPMDVGALYLSHPADIPHGSEFFEGIDDDGRIMNNHTTRLDKDGGSGSDMKSKGAVVAETKQPIIVPNSSAARGSLLKKRKQQKRSCGIGNGLIQQQGLEKREGRPLQIRNHQEMLTVDETTVHKTQVVLPTRQEPISLATNIQDPQKQVCRSFRIIIKNKPTINKGEPRSLPKDSLEMTPREDVKLRQDPRGTTVTRNSPTAATTKQPLPGHVIKNGTSAQPLEDPKVDLGKRKMPLADDKELERTRRKLREAYQEAEDEKKKRTIQVMKPHDAPKPDKSPVRKPRRSVRRG